MIILNAIQKYIYVFLFRGVIPYTMVIRYQHFGKLHTSLTYMKMVTPDIIETFVNANLYGVPNTECSPPQKSYTS
jgi:hypothetical protein